MGNGPLFRDGSISINLPSFGRAPTQGEQIDNSPPPSYQALPQPDALSPPPSIPAARSPVTPATAPASRGPGAQDGPERAEVEHIVASSTVAHPGAAMIFFDRFHIYGYDRQSLKEPPPPPPTVTDRDQTRSLNFCASRLDPISGNLVDSAVAWTGRPDIQVVWIRLTADDTKSVSCDVAFLINSTVLTAFDLHPQVSKQKELLKSLSRPWLQTIGSTGTVGVDYPGDIVFKKALANNTTTLAGIDWTAHTFKDEGRRDPWIRQLKDQIRATHGPPGSLGIFATELERSDRPTVVVSGAGSCAPLSFKGMAGEALDAQTTKFLQSAAPTLRGIVDDIMSYPFTSAIDMISICLLHIKGKGSTVRIDVTDASPTRINDPPSAAHVYPNGLQEKIAKRWADLCRQGVPEYDHPAMIALGASPKGARTLDRVSTKVVWREATMLAPQRGFVGRTYATRPGDDVESHRGPSVRDSMVINDDELPGFINDVLARAFAGSGLEIVSGPMAGNGPPPNAASPPVPNVAVAASPRSTVASPPLPNATRSSLPNAHTPPLPNVASPPLPNAVSPTFPTVASPVSTLASPPLSSMASPTLYSMASPTLYSMANPPANRLPMDLYLSAQPPKWSGGTMPPFRYQGLGGRILEEPTASFVNRAKADIGAIVAYIVDWPPTMRTIEQATITLLHIAGRGVSGRVLLKDTMGNNITTWTNAAYINWGVLQQVVVQRWYDLCRRGMPGVDHPEMFTFTAYPKNTQTVSVVSAAAYWEQAALELETSVESIYSERAGIPVDAGPGQASAPSAPVRGATMPAPAAPAYRALVRAPTAPAPAPANAQAHNHISPVAAQAATALTTVALAALRDGSIASPALGAIAPRAPPAGVDTGFVVSPRLSFNIHADQEMPERTRRFFDCTGYRLSHILKEILTWPSTPGRMAEFHVYLIHMRGKGSTVNVQMFDEAGVQIIPSTNEDRTDSLWLQESVAMLWRLICETGQWDHPTMLLLMGIPRSGMLNGVATRAFWVESTLPEPFRTFAAAYYAARPGDVVETYGTR
ncbi:hypothetical protein CspHIS471_0402570 [Cutaneotrichosporon sp. HIS471]|nr:hypothetical protein CspHIS471_0402570 [Cutaneotrichosporon sp. HIS471]